MFPSSEIFNLVSIYIFFSYIKNLFQSTVSLISNWLLFKHRKALSNAKQKLGILITHFVYKDFYFPVKTNKNLHLQSP